VSRDPLEIFDAETISEMHPDRRLETEEDNPWLWSRFTSVVWDSLGKNAARDVVSLRSLCEKLWLPFVAHIRDGSYGTRDFSRLLVRTRALFQNEAVLVENLTLATGPEAKKRSLKGKSLLLIPVLYAQVNKTNIQQHLKIYLIIPNIS
jgi:origin recognition complex subunit 5